MHTRYACTYVLCMHGYVCNCVHMIWQYRVLICFDWLKKIHNYIHSTQFHYELQKKKAHAHICTAHCTLHPCVIIYT